MENEKKLAQLSSWKTKGLICIMGLSCACMVTVGLVTSILWVPLVVVNLPWMIVVFLVTRWLGLHGKVMEGYYWAYDYTFYRSEKVRKALWQLMYDLMVYLYPQMKWRCMNYGYASLDSSDGHTLVLNAYDEYERFPLQMYHFVATGQGKWDSLEGRKVVEVGSGRGGGLEYIHRQMSPDQSIGLDFSQNQVAFCQQAYANIPRLQFSEGDGEHLDQVALVKDLQPDLIINVESSHCYGNFKAFIQQVSQLLSKGAYFSITDFRATQDLHQFEQDLTASGLTVVKKTDITPNILSALKLDEQRKIQLIDQNVNFLLRGFFKKFSGLDGSRINDDFKQHKCFYMGYLLQKQ